MKIVKISAIVGVCTFMSAGMCAAPAANPIAATSWTGGGVLGGESLKADDTHYVHPATLRSAAATLAKEEGLEALSRHYLDKSAALEAAAKMFKNAHLPESLFAPQEDVTGVELADTLGTRTMEAMKTLNVTPAQETRNSVVDDLVSGFLASAHGTKVGEQATTEEIVPALISGLQNYTSEEKTKPAMDAVWLVLNARAFSGLSDPTKLRASSDLELRGGITAATKGAFRIAYGAYYSELAGMVTLLRPTAVATGEVPPKTAWIENFCKGLAKGLKPILQGGNRIESAHRFFGNGAQGDADTLDGLAATPHEPARIDHNAAFGLGETLGGLLSNIREATGNAANNDKIKAMLTEIMSKVGYDDGDRKCPVVIHG